ncbi:MAG: RNase H-like domain-containing protein [Candidatus Thiodiazotropha endolucinida]|nr:DDE-type integrase/transposase/recombinase [Candidatus Thiodiazotropha taylori]MCW4342306.1 RNase H-like domain-containing protein [Candidatus Thiodiazotropha endolucinida]
MAGEATAELLNKLIERGEEVGQCLVLLRELSEREDKAAQRSERAAEREEKSKARDWELKLKELELREKELEIKNRGSQDHISSDMKIKVKLPKFVEGQDIEVFLTSFERLASVHSWPKSQWPVHLIPQLSGKALEAYSRMSLMESNNYDLIKKAILDRYGLNAWQYREKFRSCKQAIGETYKEFSVRLKSYFEHWKETEGIVNDYDQLVDLILREQLVFSSDQDLQIWLREHQPKTVAELVNLAEAYQLAHKESDQRRYQRRSFLYKNSKTDSGEKISETGKSGEFGQKQTKRACYVCDSTEHLIADCPFKVNKDRTQGESGGKPRQANSLLYSPTKQGFRGKIVDIPVVAKHVDGEIELTNGLKIMNGFVDDKPVTVLRDTGCTAIFISENLAEQKEVSGKEKDVILADGSTRKCKEVRIKLDTPYICGNVDALVMSNPFADLVIGNVGYIYTESESLESFQAMTRSMTKQNLSDELMQIKSDEKWKQDDFESTPVYDQNGRDQSYKDILCADDLVNEQNADASLNKVMQLSLSPENISRNTHFFKKSNVLYRAFHHKDGSVTNQVIVPKKYRTKLLQIAHDVPFSGHMGNRKTRNRLLQNFFWPGMFKDVAAYCRSCPNCQRSVAKGRVRKAKLIPIPPMSEPFSRVAIDIVGPLTRTKRGNRYILTLCDYSTKFPEAIPLKSIDTETVAEALLGIFSRLGIPKEILSDQGSNFTSALMKELCKLLGVKKLQSTPYHPEANGLVERFNGTLKRMLTCFVQDEQSEWDVLLPYLLFAYREVPQDTTGFSPFELLYGRHIRGPLTVIRESWEGQKDEVSNNSVLSYILQTRERLTKMSELAQKQEWCNKKKQKVYYDRNACMRSLKPGQKVSILLPSESNKLLAQWKGPFEVIEQVSPVDYVVQVGKYKKCQKSFHINMLKEWIDREDENSKSPQASNMLLDRNVDREVSIPILLTQVSDNEDTETADIENPLLVPHESVVNVEINKDISDGQYEELKTLLHSYQDVLTDIPGKTQLLQHDLKLLTDIPVCKKAYILPYALRDKVKKEVQDMVGAGIAEKSNSPYASPIVVVPKKDGSIRLCVDYRQLNQVTIFDPQPMPKLEDIINKLGKAKFFSKLDLTKGFWQIPLSENSKSKSAFVTPFGHFQFTVMPFGMVNSSASFVRLMKMVLSDFEDFADSFIDDIIIFSESWHDHLCHIKEVLEALRRACLTAKPSKCVFAYKQIEFLAHIVGNGEVHPTQEKIKAIQNIPTPKTKKQVRSFIGAIGFYRRFIPHFANSSAVITDLTANGKPNKVKWTNEHQKAFDALKSALVSYPVLQNPDFSCNFILQTDACDRGIGAVLLQENSEYRHPIIFISKKLLPREQRYSTVEKECLAIVRSCQTLREYLIGKEFSIETDHFPLQWLNKMKDQNMRLLRWSLVLQEYRFTVHHILGKNNILADMLSRSW